jgi:hypothetical protein
MSIVQTQPAVPVAVNEMAARLRDAGHVITFRPARLVFPGAWTAHCACGSGIYVSEAGTVLAGALAERRCGRLRFEGGK